MVLREWRRGGGNARLKISQAKVAQAPRPGISRGGQLKTGVIKAHSETVRARELSAGSRTSVKISLPALSPRERALGGKFDGACAPFASHESSFRETCGLVSSKDGAPPKMQHKSSSSKAGNNLCVVSSSTFMPLNIQYSI